MCVCVCELHDQVVALLEKKIVRLDVVYIRIVLFWL